jgi:hypothetical protein
MLLILRFILIIRPDTTITSREIHRHRAPPLKTAAINVQVYDILNVIIQYIHDLVLFQQ